MVATFVIEVILLFLTFVFHFIPIVVNAGSVKTETMFFSNATMSGPGAFVFIFTIILFGVALATLFSFIGKNRMDYALRLKVTSGFIAFFSIIDVILDFVSVSDWKKNFNVVPDALIFIIVVTIITIIISVVTIFLGGNRSPRVKKSHKSYSSIVSIQVGDEVTLDSTEWGAKFTFPKGSKGKVVKVIPEFVFVSLETDNGEEETVKISEYSVTKVEK